MLQLSGGARNRRVSTKEESLAKAQEFAEDWYLELCGKKARGELLSELTFAQAAERFTKEYERMSAGERNEIYVKGHRARLKNHLLPYFGKMGLSQVTSGAVQDYRIIVLSDCRMVLTIKHRRVQRCTKKSSRIGCHGPVAELCRSFIRTQGNLQSSDFFQKITTVVH